MAEQRFCKPPGRVQFPTRAPALQSGGITWYHASMKTRVSDIFAWVVITLILGGILFLALGDILFPVKPTPKDYVTQFHCVNGVMTPKGSFNDIAATEGVFCGRSSNGLTVGTLVCWRVKPCPS